MDTDDKRQKIKEDICEFLKHGLYKRDAARMVGISEDTYLRWYKEDADFADRVEANILEYKHSLIQNITKQAESNAGVALQILKIRWPNEWFEPQWQEDNDSRDSIKELVARMDAIIAAPECNHPEHNMAVVDTT